jgi:hypothetical protein
MHFYRQPHVIKLLAALEMPYLLVQVQSSGNIPKQQHARKKNVCRQ